jgi:hypothetical protein
VLVRRIGRWAGRHHDVGTWKGQWSYDSFRVHKTVIKRKRPKMEKSDFLKKRKRKRRIGFAGAAAGEKLGFNSHGPQVS